MTETPIPWKVSDARTIDDEAMIVGGAGQDFGLIAVVTVDEDAPRIVQAVNNHDALVKALTEIDDLDEQGRYGRIAREALARLNAPVGQTGSRS